MHIPTHLLSGWCFGNLFPLGARERFCCMLAATLPDLDGLGYFAGEETYWKFHHIWGHNFLAGILLSGALAAFSKPRFGAFWLYLGFFHLHLLLDLFGSGELWSLSYLFPCSPYEFSTRRAWAFTSWQNFLAGVLLLGWTTWIALKDGRTPLEYFAPRIDRKIVEALRLRFGKKF